MEKRLEAAADRPGVEAAGALAGGRAAEVAGGAAEPLSLDFRLRAKGDTQNVARKPIPFRKPATYIIELGSIF